MYKKYTVKFRKGWGHSSTQSRRPEGHVAPTPDRAEIHIYGSEHTLGMPQGAKSRDLLPVLLIKNFLFLFLRVLV